MSPKPSDPNTLNELWEENSWVVFWYAQRLSIMWGLPPREYWGPLFEHFERCAANFRPELGFKFSSYFGRRLISSVQKLMRNDSEYRRRNTDRNGLLNPEFPQIEFEEEHLWGRKESEFELIIEGLSEREKDYLRKEFIDQLPYHQIDPSVSKQRVGQILNRAKARLRNGSTR